jgi:hypothetical protein
MEHPRVQTERVTRIAQSLYPGCLVWFHLDDMPAALGLRVISSRGEVLCGVSGLMWLTNVTEMSDEAIQRKLYECLNSKPWAL